MQKSIIFIVFCVIANLSINEAVPWYRQPPSGRYTENDDGYMTSGEDDDHDDIADRWVRWSQNYGGWNRYINQEQYGDNRQASGGYSDMVGNQNYDAGDVSNGNRESYWNNINDEQNSAVSDEVQVLSSRSRNGYTYQPGNKYKNVKGNHNGDEDQYEEFDVDGQPGVGGDRFGDTKPGRGPGGKSWDQRPLGGPRYEDGNKNKKRFGDNNGERDQYGINGNNSDEQQSAEEDHDGGNSQGRRSGGKSWVQRPMGGTRFEDGDKNKKGQGDHNSDGDQYGNDDHSDGQQSAGEDHDGGNSQGRRSGGKRAQGGPRNEDANKNQKGQGDHDTDGDQNGNEGFDGDGQHGVDGGQVTGNRQNRGPGGRRVQPRRPNMGIENFGNGRNNTNRVYFNKPKKTQDQRNENSDEGDQNGNGGHSSDNDQDDGNHDDDRDQDSGPSGNRRPTHRENSNRQNQWIRNLGNGRGNNNTVYYNRDPSSTRMSNQNVPFINNLGNGKGNTNLVYYN